MKKLGKFITVEKKIKKTISIDSLKTGFNSVENHIIKCVTMQSSNFKRWKMPFAQCIIGS
tara:strand:- start:211 stop:390 length:180 start_codon:yes stop_codon:yes gene_type:complete